MPHRPKITENRWYIRRNNPKRRVKVTRVWTNDLGHTGVAYDIHAQDMQGKPVVTRSALPLHIFAQVYKRETVKLEET